MPPLPSPSPVDTDILPTFYVWFALGFIIFCLLMIQGGRALLRELQPEAIPLTGDQHYADYLSTAHERRKRARRPRKELPPDWRRNPQIPVIRIFRAPPEVFMAVDCPQDARYLCVPAEVQSESDDDLAEWLKEEM